MAQIFYTRRIRDLFRRRYWLECWDCDYPRLGPFESQQVAYGAQRVFEQQDPPALPKRLNRRGRRMTDRAWDKTDRAPKPYAERIAFAFAAVPDDVFQLEETEAREAITAAARRYSVDPRDLRDYMISRLNPDTDPEPFRIDA